MVIKMAFPSYKEIEIPLLLNIYNRGGEVSSSSCYEPLGREFGLTDEEMSILLPDDSNRPQWNNMVQWARKKLVDYKTFIMPKNQVLASGNSLMRASKKQNRFLPG